MMSRDDRGHRRRSPLDEAFAALSAAQRRRIVSGLAERDEGAFDPAQLFETDLDRTDRLELYHTHLPKLAEAGFVRWNREANTVRRGPRFDDIGRLVAVLAENRERLPSDRP